MRKNHFSRLAKSALHQAKNRLHIEVWDDKYLHGKLHCQRRSALWMIYLILSKYTRFLRVQICHLSGHRRRRRCCCCIFCSHQGVTISTVMVQSGTCFIPLFALFWALSSIPFETPHIYPSSAVSAHPHVLWARYGNKKWHKTHETAIEFLKGMLFVNSRFKARVLSASFRMRRVLDNVCIWKFPSVCSMVSRHTIGVPTNLLWCAALQSAKFIHIEHLWGDFASCVSQQIKSWFFATELIRDKHDCIYIQEPT